MAEPDDLRAQYEEAERLVREAQRAAEEAAAGAVPPRGWSVPGDEGSGSFPDLGQLAALLESLRGVVPPELARQLADALRELLIASGQCSTGTSRGSSLRSPPSSDVEDIPVE